MCLPLRMSTHCSIPERNGEVANWDSRGPRALTDGAMKGDRKGMESVAGRLLKPADRARVNPQGDQKMVVSTLRIHSTLNVCLLNHGIVIQTQKKGVQQPRRWCHGPYQTDA